MIRALTRMQGSKVQRCPALGVASRQVDAREVCNSGYELDDSSRHTPVQRGTAVVIPCVDVEMVSGLWRGAVLFDELLNALWILCFHLPGITHKQ